MRELQKLSTRRNNDTNEDKDASYDFKYFLLCYWVISFNFWRICWFSCSDCGSCKTLCTFTSTVQLPFPCTFSPIQKINYGDKQFWRLWQNFDLEIYLRIRANLIQFLDTEMKSTWWKQGKVYLFLFIERANLPSFASRSEITPKTTAQKQTSWMLHYLIATWASSSILKDLWWILCFQTGSFSTWSATKWSLKYRAINRDIVAIKAFRKKK